MVFKIILFDYTFLRHSINVSSTKEAERISTLTGTKTGTGNLTKLKLKTFCSSVCFWCLFWKICRQIVRLVPYTWSETRNPLMLFFMRKTKMLFQLMFEKLYRIIWQGNEIHCVLTLILLFLSGLFYGWSRYVIFIKVKKLVKKVKKVIKKNIHSWKQP